VANPWLKKNPFMSLWLSGANAAAGSLRGQAMGQAKRQATAAMAQATKNVVDAWTVGLAPPAAAKTRKRKPKRR
jgi:hypothetical protein